MLFACSKLSFYLQVCNGIFSVIDVCYRSASKASASATVDKLANGVAKMPPHPMASARLPKPRNQSVPVSAAPAKPPGWFL